MRIVDALLGEHGVFYAWFDALEGAATTGAGDPRDQAATLSAALEPHARLENELLFDPALATAAGKGGPLAVVREEHDAIEDLLRAARREDEPVRARALLLDAIARARDHFEREERVAFDLATEALGEERMSALGARWAERRGVRLA